MRNINNSDSFYDFETKNIIKFAKSIVEKAPDKEKAREGILMLNRFLVNDINSQYCMRALTYSDDMLYEFDIKDKKNIIGSNQNVKEYNSEEDYPKGYYPLITFVRKSGYRPRGDYDAIDGLIGCSMFIGKNVNNEFQDQLKRQDNELIYPCGFAMCSNGNHAQFIASLKGERKQTIIKTICNIEPILIELKKENILELDYQERRDMYCNYLIRQS